MDLPYPLWSAERGILRLFCNRALNAMRESDVLPDVWAENFFNNELAHIPYYQYTVLFVAHDADEVKVRLMAQECVPFRLAKNEEKARAIKAVLRLCQMITEIEGIT